MHGDACERENVGGHGMCVRERPTWARPCTCVCVTERGKQSCSHGSFISYDSKHLSRVPLITCYMLNIFLENIMREALHECPTSLSISDRPSGNLRFVNDIGLITNRTARPYKRSDSLNACRMETSTDTESWSLATAKQMSTWAEYGSKR